MRVCPLKQLHTHLVTGVFDFGMSGFDHCVTGKRGYHFSTATMLDGAAVSIEKLHSSSGGEPQLMCFVCACSCT